MQFAAKARLLAGKGRDLFTLTDCLSSWLLLSWSWGAATAVASGSRAVGQLLSGSSVVNPKFWLLNGNGHLRAGCFTGEAGFMVQS